jgi:hypothetical protein
MSGEFLRAVLDTNMADGELAIYTVEAIVPAGPPGIAFGAVLPCKMDRYFLAMGVEFKGVSVADVLSDLSFNLAEITNPADLSVFGNQRTKPAFYGGNLNGFYNLDSYMLFEPAALIGFQILNNATQGTALTVGSTVTLTLYGVEYRTKD